MRQALNAGPATDDRITSAALRLRAAEQRAEPCAPIRDLIALDDLQSAYAVQQLNTAFAVASGRRIVGRKIGLTSLAVQKQLGVDQPDFGALFADMCFGDAVEVPYSRTLQPKVEAEVVCVIGRDLTVDQATLPDVMRAVDSVLPGIEIVGSRVANWDIRIVDTIGDNASSGLFVLGNQPRRLADLDLRLCGMALELNGEIASTGAGGACLGHPLHALLWLARKMVEVGTPLRAGDIVLTGALGPMCAVQRGDWVEARISGLGSVRTRFA
jgi:2-keto-4-pentenoate hydratase